MITLLTAVLVLVSITVVTWPLLRGIGGRSGLVEDTEFSELLAQQDAALLAISELESDYNMGNLSRSDYQELRQKYEEKAVALMKTADGLRSERGLDTVADMDGREADGASCPGCGAAAPSGAVFCSRCGAALGAQCPDCSSAVGVGDRFCFRCGGLLDTGEDEPDEP